MILIRLNHVQFPVECRTGHDCRVRGCDRLDTRWYQVESRTTGARACRDYYRPEPSEALIKGRRRHDSAVRYPTRPPPGGA